MNRIKQPKNRVAKGTQATSAFIVGVLEKAAKKIGATITMEPEWRYAGQVTYPSGLRRYFRLSTLDLNTMGASEIARDKDFARFFLADMGYPVPKGTTFFSPEWAKSIGALKRKSLSEAWAYAKSLGLPVFVKPNSKSRGVGVSKATSWTEFCRAYAEAMKREKVIVVEKAVHGRDYRLVVLDGKVISAYERIPLTITGDGRSTIHRILTAKKELFLHQRGEASVSLKDYRLTATLKRLGLTMKSVLPKGKDVQLLDNANLSAGGTSVDVTGKVHPDFTKLAVNIARDMGLRLTGVDLMIDGDITKAPRQGHYWVIEVNSAPGLDHYAAMGHRQQKVVEDLYFQVLKAMERAN